MHPEGVNRDSRESSHSVGRREAIRRVAAVLGGVALVGGNALIAACSRERQTFPDGERIGEFTAEDIAFLDEVAETILPETTTPGAKAAQTGAFMALMVTDGYDARDQRIFRRGMRRLEQASRRMHGRGFVQANPQQRLALLERLDREQKQHMDTARPGGPGHYFRMMKELALLGYFTSEIGCTQAQRYIESPGRFDPCVPYEQGERAWAAHA